MTALGGLFHTLPFIISDVHTALLVAGCVVAVELFTIAWIRKRFLEVSMRSSLLLVTVGGLIVLAIGIASGHPESGISLRAAKTRWYTGLLRR